MGGEPLAWRVVTPTTAARPVMLGAFTGRLSPPPLEPPLATKQQFQSLGR